MVAELWGGEGRWRRAAGVAGSGVRRHDVTARRTVAGGRPQRDVRRPTR